MKTSLYYPVFWFSLLMFSLNLSAQTVTEEEQTEIPADIQVEMPPDELNAPAAELAIPEEIPSAELNEIPAEIEMEIGINPDELSDVPAEQDASLKAAMEHSPKSLAPSTPNVVFSELSNLLQGTRWTIKHRYGKKLESPRRPLEQRTSLRGEYERFFADDFYFRLDGIANIYWDGDHQADAAGEVPVRRTTTKEFYLQHSQDRLSVRGGRQIVIWGEADGMAITDVISPRDYSEFYFIPLEESRLGQDLLLLDYYSSAGRFSAFYNPQPGMDREPQRDTAYDLNEVDQTQLKIEKKSPRGEEYGLRWKKTYGKSDLSLMVARVLANQYAYKADGFSTNNRTILKKFTYHYNLLGSTFVWAWKNILLKGEMAWKEQQRFNNAAYDTLEKSVFDLYLGLEYLLNATQTLRLDLFNRYLRNWEEDIIEAHENESTIGLNWNSTHLNEDLVITLNGSYLPIAQDQIYSAELLYTVNDNLKIESRLFAFISTDQQSSLYPYRDQDRWDVTLIYQF